MSDKQKKLELQTVIQALKSEVNNNTMEGHLLRRKLIKSLYTLAGDPEECDFPEEYHIAGYGWKKHAGYTGDIDVLSKNEMLMRNAEVTDWHIERASHTKVQIVERYEKACWACTVYAMNVICTKYVKHPHIDNLWVEFYSSRDCNKYRYVIEDK
jgi:hypothetical protein